MIEGRDNRLKYIIRILKDNYPVQNLSKALSDGVVQMENYKKGFEVSQLIDVIKKGIDLSKDIDVYLVGDNYLASTYSYIVELSEQ